MADPYINAERAHRWIAQQVTTKNTNKLPGAEAVELYQLRQRERFAWAQLVQARQLQRTPADWRRMLPIWETWGNAAARIGSLLMPVTVAGSSIQKETGKAMRAARAASRAPEKSPTDLARDAGVWLGLVVLGLGLVEAARRGPGRGWRR
jgi:hypothetical protein